MSNSLTDDQTYPCLGVGDLAEKLKVSGSTVRRLIASREISHHIVGGQLRISQRDLDIYLQRTRVDAVS